MKHLYQPEAVQEIKQRLSRLDPTAAPRWGRMTPAQALAHCSRSLEMALGRFNPPRKLLGRVFGRVAKRSLIDRGDPMRRNAPTDRQLVISDARDFSAERARLLAMVAQFVEAGPEGCTRHPHLFMGSLKPVEWAVLMYQHLDHHLRQYSV